MFASGGGAASPPVEPRRMSVDMVATGPNEWVGGLKQGCRNGGIRPAARFSSLPTEQTRGRRFSRVLRNRQKKVTDAAPLHPFAHQ